MEALNHLALPAATALMLASAVVLHNYRTPATILSMSELSNIIFNYISDIKNDIVAHIKDPALTIDTISSILDKMFMIDTKQTREEQIAGKQPLQQFRQTKYEKLINPPTRTAILAWIIFILSAQYIHEAHQKDRYQNSFLVTGLIIGFNSSFVAWMISAENLFAFKTFVPASVIGALVLSSLVHRLGFGKEVVVVREDKKDQ